MRKLTRKGKQVKEVVKDEAAEDVFVMFEPEITKMFEYKVELEGIAKFLHEQEQKIEASTLESVVTRLKGFMDEKDIKNYESEVRLFKKNPNSVKNNFTEKANALGVLFRYNLRENVPEFSEDGGKVWKRFGEGYDNYLNLVFQKYTIDEPRVVKDKKGEDVVVGLEFKEMSGAVFEKHFSAACVENEVDLFKEYLLEGAKWDGTAEHLSKWDGKDLTWSGWDGQDRQHPCLYFEVQIGEMLKDGKGVEADVYKNEVLAEWGFKNVWNTAVTRTLEPGRSHDICLCLIGPQRVGK